MDVLRMRKTSRMTQEDFWGRIGISQSGGSRYERGRSIPEPVRILLALAYGTAKERELTLHALLPQRASSCGQSEPRAGEHSHATAHTRR